MKTYYTSEYRSIKWFDGHNAHTFKQMQQMQENTDSDVKEYFEEFHRDVFVGREQIQQMLGAFQGASNALTETMNLLQQTNCNTHIHDHYPHQHQQTTVRHDYKTTLWQ